MAMTRDEMVQSAEKKFNGEKRYITPSDREIIQGVVDHLIAIRVLTPQQPPVASYSQVVFAIIADQRLVSETQANIVRKAVRWLADNDYVTLTIEAHDDPIGTLRMKAVARWDAPGEDKQIWFKYDPVRWVCIYSDFSPTHVGLTPFGEDVDQYPRCTELPRWS